MRSLIFLILIYLLNFIYSVDCLDKEKDCKCRIKASSRIVGGHEVPKQLYPWQISLADDSYHVSDAMRHLVPVEEKLESHFCGGVIVNEYWILTAVHCLEPGFEYRNKIGYGDNDLVRIYDQKKYAKIQRGYKHHSFHVIETIYKGIKFNYPVYDIALIKLSTPLNFDEDVQPACLGIKNVTTYDGVLKMTGWGSTNVIVNDHKRRQNTLPFNTRYLKEGETFDRSDNLEICKEHKDKFICVDNIEKKDSACFGDSGGPLMHTENGKTSVIGVSSFGDVQIIQGSVYKTCHGPAVFSRLNALMSWVERVIGQNYCH